MRQTLADNPFVTAALTMFGGGGEGADARLLDMPDLLRITWWWLDVE
jgi:hypothetical protein